MTPKIDGGVIHVLRLAERDADFEGWAAVSPMVLKAIKSQGETFRDLIEIAEAEDGSGQVRCTDDARVLIKHWPAIVKGMES